MPEMRIPEEQRKSLVTLARLSEDQIKELLTVAETLPAATTIFKDFSDQAFEKLKAIDRNEVKGLLETLFTLHMVRTYYDMSVEEFLTDVIAALGKQGQELTQENRAYLAKSLAQLLGVKSLAISAKAQGLQREHLLVLHDARIICDLRPVFESPADFPIGFVVAYTLHIVFHKGPHHEDIYFALDENDIAKLKTVVERAQTKTSSLKSLMSDKGLNQVG
jgi:hypothetical protein